MGKFANIIGKITTSINRKESKHENGKKTLRELEKTAITTGIDGTMEEGSEAPNEQKFRENKAEKIRKQSSFKGEKKKKGPAKSSKKKAEIEEPQTGQKGAQKQRRSTKRFKLLHPQTKEERTVKKPPPTPAFPEGEATLQAFKRFYNQVSASRIQDFSENFAELCEVPLGPAITVENSLNPKVPLLEATKVTVEEGESTLYHASQVSMEGMSFIIGQVPSGNPEDLWEMVFFNALSVILVVTPYYEDGKKVMDEFYPAVLDSHSYFGKMFVNNKKIVQDKSAIIYTVEVLPKSYSNSFVTRLVHCLSWKRDGLADTSTFQKLIKHVKEEAGGRPMMILSKSGTGRPAVVVAYVSLLNALLSGNYMNWKEIFTKIREQRAGAINNLLQYITAISSILPYMMKKSSIKENQAKWKKLIEHIKGIMNPA